MSIHAILKDLYLVQKDLFFKKRVRPEKETRALHNAYNQRIMEFLSL